MVATQSQEQLTLKQEHNTYQQLRQLLQKHNQNRLHSPPQPPGCSATQSAAQNLPLRTQSSHNLNSDANILTLGIANPKGQESWKQTNTLTSTAKSCPATLNQVLPLSTAKLKARGPCPE